MFCNNCGIKGHTYKECKKPVMSYGILLYKIENKIPKILMIQRKDSLCYIEFLRGKYDIYNLYYIQILIDKFTLEEKQNVLNNSFDQLWNDLWLIKPNTTLNNYLKTDYQKGKQKFNQLKEGYFYHKKNIMINFPYFIDKSKTTYLTSEWEFPKGRRNNNENNKECAIREFKEETNYESQDYQLIDNIYPISEEYRGENRVYYKHIYYIGILTNYDKEITIDLDNFQQVSEIKKLQWVTKEESLQIIRDYHKTRKKIIIQIFNFLDELNQNFFIVQ